MVNIHTIGAGGGSLAYVEAGGLRVGPQSAGATPGPVCYGGGGTQPTVTDANLLLGRLDPAYFLGGRIELDIAGAEAAVAKLAEQLRLDTVHLAEGIVDVINAKMAQAIRTITVEKGIEPREFTLVAFGGAGPLHAAFLADELEIPEVIVPRHPGAFSAWGMLQTALRHDAARPFYHAVDSESLVIELQQLVAELAQEGSATITAEGVDAETVDLVFSTEMRYVGQEYTVTVDFEPDELADPAFLATMRDRFHEAHARRYGHANRQAPAEFVIVRLGTLGELGRKPPERLARNGNRADSAPYHSRLVVFDRAPRETAIVFRTDLLPGTTIVGPTIIEEPTATTVVPPGATAALDPYGSILISLPPKE
jgi:N-methylhydantoinase A